MARRIARIQVGATMRDDIEIGVINSQKYHDALGEFTCEETIPAQGAGRPHDPNSRRDYDGRSIRRRTAIASPPLRGLTRWSLVPFGCGVVVGALAVITGVPADASRARTDRQPPTSEVTAVGAVATAGIQTPPQSLSGELPTSAPPAVAAADVSQPRAARVQTGVTGSARAGRAPFRGALVVNSDPQGAGVYINGRQSGTTPLVLRNLTVGSRAVRVELVGYQPWSSSIRVVADRSTPVMAALDPVRD